MGKIDDLRAIAPAKANISISGTVNNNSAKTTKKLP
jgi:hypothetical protein